MDLWDHLQKPECAEAERIVRRFGTVLDDLGARAGGGPHEFVHGWPKSLLPYPKPVIEFALLRYGRCLASVGRLDQEKLEALRVGYGAMAWFVPDAEALRAAWVTQGQLAGGAMESSAAGGNAAWDAAHDLVDRVLAECIERRRDFDALVEFFRGKTQ